MQPGIQPDMQKNASVDLLRLNAALSGPGTRGGGGIVVDYYPEIDSTMRAAHALGRRGEIASGSVVVADAQTAGRGRLGRSWEAPPGSSLLMSILLKQNEVMSERNLFPVIAGLAVQRALDGMSLPGVSVGLKWPNDILLRTADGVERKTGGILVESTLEQESMAGHVVIGIGINMVQDATQLPHVEPPAPEPTSLRLASGVILDRTRLLISIWRAFFEVLQWPLEGKYDSGRKRLFAEWRAVLWTLGRPVVVHHADGSTLHGVAVDIDDDPLGSGALIVEDTAGARHIVHSGDVSLRPG
jgi:BirA family biotin operon repressor/biotin-[acetyl-CoA-carboxylase] ligase